MTAWLQDAEKCMIAWLRSMVHNLNIELWDIIDMNHWHHGPWLSCKVTWQSLLAVAAAGHKIWYHLIRRLGLVRAVHLCSDGFYKSFPWGIYTRPVIVHCSSCRIMLGSSFHPSWEACTSHAPCLVSIYIGLLLWFSRWGVLGSPSTLQSTNWSGGRLWRWIT